MRNSESNSGNTSICKVPSPDTISYNVTINALAKSNIGNNGYVCNFGKNDAVFELTLIYVTSGLI